MVHRVIYKFPLGVTDEQDIEMPAGAKILSAQLQHDRICIWALCEKHEEVKQTRSIRVFGTGNSISLDDRMFKLEYISTVQMGPFVWHVFEKIDVIPF